MTVTAPTRGASVADIVRCARCARNTFYDTFGGKGDAGRALLSETCPCVDRSPEDEASVVLAVELAALWRSGERDAALKQAEEAHRLLTELAQRELSQESEDDSLAAQLPPGRHGLPVEFVRENHRSRLLEGLVASVYESGYLATTIARITRHAAVSRRTFYEHFESADASAAALLDSVGCAADPSTALGAVAVEVAASKLSGDDGRTAADPLLRILIARFQEGE